MNLWSNAPNCYTPKQTTNPAELSASQYGRSAAVGMPALWLRSAAPVCSVLGADSAVSVPGLAQRKGRTLHARSDSLPASAPLCEEPHLK
jgi:hypothetical protein